MTRSDVAGRVDQYEGNALAHALFVESDHVEHRIERDPFRLHWETGLPADVDDFRAQLVVARKAQRAGHTDAHSLAVAQIAVARDGFDRVADRVAEVEDLADILIALVGGDDLQLRARALKNDPRIDRLLEVDAG